MAKKPNNGDNQKRNRPTENPYGGSLLPDDMLSLDPDQVIDYTGTIGSMPESLVSEMPMDSIEADDTAVTRMVDDDFYKQIQSFFPVTGSGSGSRGDSGSVPADSEASAEDVVGASAHPDGAPSLSVRGVKGEFSHSDFVPPVRDIRFPSDTQSLEDALKSNPSAVISDEYGVVSKLGEGGYGVVFEAEQRALNRPVAVKVLKPKRKHPGSKSHGRSGTGSGELQRRRDQFLHEAKITARLQHPNIVPLYDFGVNKTGQLFYSMKKVEKRPWSSILHSTAKVLGIQESQVDDNAEREAITKNVEIFMRVCDAMAYTHAQHIVHRDLKPDNIMIGDYGEVLLIDFGMALDLADPSNPEFSAGGTLVYMAPEMAKHFAKQKEIQVAARRTAKRLGEEQGSVFLDKSNLTGIGQLARELIQQSKDQGVIDLAETLIRLDSEEKQLAQDIGISSDIYLLGAILYQVAVGHPPHYYPIAHCKNGKKEKFQRELWLALRNGCQQYSKITDPLRLSLRNIAVQAMKTDPADRYQTVEELQAAIRNFQLQVQSLELLEAGKEGLEKAAGGTGYQHLLPALESFRGATELWPQGAEAPAMQVQAACEFAKRAEKQRDFDAGLSILDEYVADDQKNEANVIKARQRLNDGKRRRSRNRILAAIGWLAAIIAPLGVWGLSYQQLASQSETIKINEKRNANLSKEISTKREELKAKDDEIKAQAASVTQAKQEAATEIRQIELDNQNEIVKIREQAQADAKRIKQQAQAAAQAEVNNIRKQAKIEKAKALNDAKAAQAQAEVSRRKAAELEFDANFAEYNKNILTLPFALRTGKLTEVAQQLREFALSSAKPMFQNGWDVAHFAKRAEANTNGLKLPNGGEVRRLLSDAAGNRWALTGGRSPALFSLSEQGAAAVNLELPTADMGYGSVMDAAVSLDGSWLAIALDDATVTDVDAQTAQHLWIVNLKSGKRLLDTADSAGVIGCRTLAFGPENQLIALEELSGRYSSNARLQVVLRTIVNDQITAAEAVAISATTRDAGRPLYLGVAQWDGDTPLIGVAFQTLNRDLEETFRLETLMAAKGADFQSSRIEIKRIPTVLYFGNARAFYSGQADGDVYCYNPSQLTLKPVFAANENEDQIVSFVAAPNGQLLSGSANGKIVLWNQGLNYVKQLSHQPGALTTMTVSAGNQKDGFELLTADNQGTIVSWFPQSGIHDWRVRHESPVAVTTGAIDASPEAGAIPSTAYGTSNGDVYYFDAQAMISRGRPDPLQFKSSITDAKFRFGSPFEKFDSTFNDFDSMGIVDDHFVLMKDDGTFFSTFIDTTDGNASPRSQRIDLSSGRDLFGTFSPLMASVTDKNYFFTSNPLKPTSLLVWRKSGARFDFQPVKLASSSEGLIKRIAMSPDGRWLGAVRTLERKDSGTYVVEIYDLQPVISGTTQPLPLVDRTNSFQVGDPAFVGFSPDSQRMLLHLHKSRIDRETSIEQWEFDGSQWSQTGKPTKIDDRKVAVVDWKLDPGSERLVTKLNRKYFLTQREDARFKQGVFQYASTSTQNRIRSVRATGDGNDRYLVLSNNELCLYTGTEKSKSANFASQINDARDMRVYGNQAVILDQSGFHLVDSELNYVTMLADRKVSVRQVAVAGNRLAILYSNRLCRVWNVAGEKPTAVGAVENVSSVTLSPDGRWAGIRTDDQLGIYSIESTFTDPKMNHDVANSVYEWIGQQKSKLLVAQQNDAKTRWQTVDPAAGAVADRNDLPVDLTVDEFSLAPITGNYLATKTGTQLALWHIGETWTKLDQTHEFDPGKVANTETFSFSEIKQEKEEAIGTRLSVMTMDPSTKDRQPRLFLLASDTVKLATPDAVAVDNQAEPGAAIPVEPVVEAKPIVKHKVVEIEGALEKRLGFNLLDIEFSGDGRSLLQVDDRGTTTLLSKTTADQK